MRKAFTLIEAVVGVAIVGILAVIIMPVFNRPRCGNPRDSSCQINLKQIALAAQQYHADFETLPPLSHAGKGWAELLTPYANSTWIFECPSAKPSRATSSDYFLNAQLAAQPLPSAHAARIVFLGEGPDNAATNAHFSELPFDVATHPESFVRRHHDGGNYAFADGHVKWFKPDKITNEAPNEMNYTFGVPQRDGKGK